MAGSKINDYSIGDSNIQSVMLTLDKAFKGFYQVSLTNYNTTDESAIAAGSVVEVNGAFYKFDADESITGSPSDGTVYIYLVPSGDTITAAYTNTAPTWSDSKQGWYGTGGNANYRCLEFILYKNSALWYKFNLTLNDKSNNIILYAKAPGTQTITSTSDTQITFNKIYDIGDNFSLSTFTSPSDSLYAIGLYCKNSPASTPFKFISGRTSASAFDFDVYQIKELGATFGRMRGRISVLLAGETYKIYCGFATTPNETITNDSYLVIKKICDI